MKESLVIVGVGNLAPEVVDFVQRYDLFDIVAFSVDKKYITSSEYMGKPVYPLEELEKHVEREEVKVFIAISWYNYLNKYKRQKFEFLKEKGFHFANLISPLASVKTDHIGEGNWIMDFATIGFNTEIGDNNTFCAQSILAHHTILGNHNVLSGRSSVAGRNIIGDQNYFGFCSVVFNELIIGNKNIIGGGSIIKKNIGNYTITTAPESYHKQLREKSIEFFLSPKSVEFLKALQ